MWAMIKPKRGVLKPESSRIARLALRENLNVFSVSQHKTHQPEGIKLEFDVQIPNMKVLRAAILISALALCSAQLPLVRKRFEQGAGSADSDSDQSDESDTVNVNQQTDDDDGSNIVRRVSDDTSNTARRTGGGTRQGSSNTATKSGQGTVDLGSLFGNLGNIFNLGGLTGDDSSEDSDGKGI